MTQIPPNDTSDESGDNGTVVTPEEGQSRREAAAARAEADKLRQENRNLQLDGLIHQIGGDPASGIGKMFKQTYDGDLTLEAVSTAIDGLGLPVTVLTPSEPGGPDITDDERQSTDERQRAAGGAAPDANAPTKDPRALGVKEGSEIMMDGSLEAGVGQFFDRVAHAAYTQGDARAVWQPGMEDTRRGRDLGW